MSNVVQVEEVTRYVINLEGRNRPDQFQDEFPYSFGSRLGPEFDAEGTTMAWIASPLIAMIYSLNGAPHSAFSLSPRILKSTAPMTSIRLGKCTNFRLPWKVLGGEPSKEGYLLLATGLRNGCIKIYNALTCSLLTNLLSHTSVVSDLVFHPFKNGLYTQIVSVSMDKSLKVWDQEDHSYNMSETITTLDPLLTVAWSPNGRYVASAGTGRIVYIHTGFHKKNISLKHRLKRHYEDIVSLQFSSDSALLFSASLDTRIHVWDSEEGTIRQTLCRTFPVPLLVFSNHVTSMCINNLGSFVASVCNEDDSQSRLRLWDLEGFKDFPTVNNSDSRCVPQANRRALSCSVTRNSLLSVLNEDRSVSLYSVICSPPSLKHMSRTKIRTFIHLQENLHGLDIPKALLKYLKYETWK
uniref:WD repeat and SOCS box-containing protein 1 n=1 Tax=Lepeophtheirus salmonis TaxID=72036 RepID=C1BVC5_LEPSM|nr:WD repeat and SOCS box-containing protein 1 [Lepeophtheirus salmonis]